MMGCPNNDFSLKEASWAVDLRSGQTTLEAATSAQGREGLPCEGRVGAGSCGPSRLKNTWSSDQNPVHASSPERHGAKGF